MKLVRGSCVLVALLGISLAVVACGVGPREQTPTLDYPRLETAVAQQLFATLTSKAPPTVTRTPSPSPLSSSASPVPTGTTVPTLAPPEAEGDLIAYVRLSQDASTNIALSDEGHQIDQLLTHFVEVSNMCDVHWSADGEWIVFVSAHDFMFGRDNERNVFMIRADGTGLEMVTGDHRDPEEVPGPYVTLEGRVMGCEGPALVSAEGVAAPVTTDDAAVFELVGVPVTARWVRALCASGTQVLQGDVDLDLDKGTTEAITIEVKAEGHGWLQASPSPDGHSIAGTMYDWYIDEEGDQQVERMGVLYDIETGTLALVETPDGARSGYLVWSPVNDVIAGAVTDGDGTSLWLWDAQGQATGEIVTLDNPDDVIYAIEDPAWSPDGNSVAFVRRDWGRWEDNQYKSDLLVVSASGEDLRTLVANEWGTAVSHPSWSSDGRRIYYQVSPASADGGSVGDEMSIWSVPVEIADGGEAPEATPWLDDGASGFPCVRPIPTPFS